MFMPRCFRSLATLSTRHFAQISRIPVNNFYTLKHPLLRASVSTVSREEIKHENEVHETAQPPHGFNVVKRAGPVITIEKNCDDQSVVSIDLNLSGSVTPAVEGQGEGDNEAAGDQEGLDVRPEMKIRITKPSGKAIIFNCSLPVNAETSAAQEDNQLFTVDSVEFESMQDYFVYTDLFDDRMYDHLMRLLTERGLDERFQEETHRFCVAEEHLLYNKFLSELKDFCAE